MGELDRLPILYKKTAAGKTQTWQIWVEEKPDGTADIAVSHGLLDGKQQITRDTIRSGKNAGKVNATTPLTQALAEAKASWQHQLDRNHYGLTVEESAGKRDVAPMLAQVLGDYKKPIDWTTAYGQPKLDGHRCLAFRERDGKIRLMSRQGKEIPTLPHVQSELALHMRADDVFDGELYVHGVPLNTVGSWIKREQEDSKRIVYNIYDKPSDVPFKDRLYALNSLATDAEKCVRIVWTQKVNSLDELMHFQQICIEQGYEGAMLRHSVAPYESGKRSPQLLKVKTWQDSEFVITAVREGRGTFDGMAIFECSTHLGHVFEVTAPGTHEEKRLFWTNREQCIGKKVTIKYAYMTNTETPVPFHPVALRLREDI